MVADRVDELRAAGGSGRAGRRRRPDRRIGARAVRAAFDDRVVDSVEYVESERMRSHLGCLEVAGVEVELIGALLRDHAGDDGQ